mmetsp:Transcript_8003/g.20259  ORF Transcript_8003/g.20259 Transcript_8003/m.20259 type:complete len:282 (+) Transcript_8003:250-1095(+)
MARGECFSRLGQHSRCFSGCISGGRSRASRISAPISLPCCGSHQGSGRGLCSMFWKTSTGSMRGTWRSVRGLRVRPRQRLLPRPRMLLRRRQFRYKFHRLVTKRSQTCVPPLSSAASAVFRHGARAKASMARSCNKCRSSSSITTITTTTITKLGARLKRIHRPNLSSRGSSALHLWRTSSAFKTNQRLSCGRVNIRHLGLSPRGYAIPHQEVLSLGGGFRENDRKASMASRCAVHLPWKICSVVGMMIAAALRTATPTYPSERFLLVQVCQWNPIRSCSA